MQPRRGNTVTLAFRRSWCLALPLSALAACATPAPTPPELTRYLVYFDEFSANLSPAALGVVANAAKAAQQAKPRTIQVQARASATGTPETNMKLAETRSSIVTDQLAADGIPRTLIQQVPIGQTGSNDPTVYNRRVDIVFEP
jgi:outer membrane protein OmpA-like peptidoglycan-associated protein